MFQSLVKKARITLLVAILVPGLGACTESRPAQSLSVSDAWIRLSPPGAMMTAGYGRFENTGNESVVLTGFSSPQFGDVTLHYTEDVDGTSRMREAGPTSLAPGESLTLQPGGFHLMLMKRKVPTPEGFSVDIVIETGQDEEGSKLSSSHVFKVSRR